MMTGEPRNTSDGPARAPRLGRDFASRFVSGAVLSALVLTLLLLGAKPFAVFVGLAAILIAWEWSRIIRGAQPDLAFGVHAVSAGLAAALAGLGVAALGLAATVAGALIVFLLTFGGRSLLSALGVLYSGMPAVALLWLRGDEPHGLAAVIFLIVCVAATDIAAFMAGRTLGGLKLAPSLSPNKTWSGLIGGMSASAIVAALFGWAVGAAPLALAATGALLALVAQAGDLTESALKRSFGVKDAGSIIPGHGGVMDRVDGLIFAAIAGALLGFALNAGSPASGLLFGG